MADKGNKLWVAPAMGGALLFLSPLIYSVVMSFQTADSFYRGGFDFTLANYDRAVGQHNFGKYLINSVIVAGSVTLAGPRAAGDGGLQPDNPSRPSRLHAG